MLLIWPLVTLLLFLALPTRRAIVWSLVAGYLLLPPRTAFAFSGFPDLDKTTLPNIVTFLFAMTLARRGDFRWRGGFILNMLLLIYLVSPFLTGLTNPDPQQQGRSVWPGMTLYDSLSMTGGHVIDVLPFILGAGFLRDERSHRELITIYVLAAVAYTLPVLEEIRMAPLLARNIYGILELQYFIQSMRGGGFRAMVFLSHGLLVSAFLALGVMGAAGLWRERRALWGVPASLITAFLFVVLVLNKSAGAIGLTFLLVPAFLLMTPRRFVSLAAIVAAIVVAYPLLRSADLIPTETFRVAMEQVSPSRAQSFGFRVANEDLQLAHVRERMWFGWGGWGRSLITPGSEFQGTLINVSVPDGTWILTIGTFGWIGYIALFGLLTYPIWHVYRIRKQGLPIISVALVGMLTLNLIDLIPNSSLRPITWLIAGSLSALVLAPAGRRIASRQRVAPDFSKIGAAAA
jgi:hypothetical protein